MTPIDRLLHTEPDPRTRVLFMAGDDPTVIEAASMASARGLATPLLFGSAEKARQVAGDVDIEDIVFLDLVDMGVATPVPELASLLVREGVAHGAMLGPDVDVREAARALEHEHPVAASVFLEFSTGPLVVLTADLSERSVDLAELYVRDLMGSDVTVCRFEPEALGDRRSVTDPDEVVLCNIPDHDFAICEVLRCFGGADAYGPILFGSRIPAAFVRPAASVEDVLGSVALLSATIGPQPEEVTVSAAATEEREPRPLW